MSITEAYDVICVGNYTKDTIESPTGTEYVDGGAVNYAAHAAAGLGLKTAVVTRLAREDVHVVEGFTRAGIDCFVTYAPQSTCMRLEYPTADPDVRHLSVTGTAGSITVDEVKTLRAKAALVGSSLRGEVGLDVIQALSEKGLLLAADVQGFVRVLRGQNLANEPWEEMEATLAYLDVLKSDAVEAEFLTGETDMCRAALAFARMGPGEIVITHKDGVLICAEGRFHEARFYARNLDGRSGRGDTCVGAYVATRLSKPPAEAGVWAAAVTSLKMETVGPFQRSRREVEDLLRQEYAFDPSSPPSIVG